MVARRIPGWLLILLAVVLIGLFFLFVILPMSR